MVRVALYTLAVLAAILAGPVYAEVNFNVDLSCGWDGYYRPMEWTPIEVGIGSNLKQPWDGTLVVSARQDDLNTLNIRRYFALTPDVPRILPLVTKFAFGADRCDVRILDLKGRSLWSYPFDLWSRRRQGTVNMLNVVNDEDLLIGLIGSRRFSLIDISRYAICRFANKDGRVYVGHKLQHKTPWDWTAFASLDLLVLYDPDWGSFRDGELRAVKDWVSNGGRLMVILGSHLISARSAAGELVPFEIQPPKQTTIPPNILTKWQLRDNGAESVVCQPITPRANVLASDSETLDTGECLFAVGCLGFGKVAVLAFDPATLTTSQAANAPRFWVNRIAAILKSDSSDNPEPPEPPAPRQRPRTRRSSQCPLTGDLVHPDSMQGGIKLTLAGLKHDTYRMTSWHNNPYSGHANFDIYVNAALTSSNNPQSRVQDDQSAAKAVTTFKVVDDNDIVVEFRPVDSSGDRRVMLCGFELETIDPDDKWSLNVDFGASGQIVAPDHIGLGVSDSARQKRILFSSADGLPDGITLAVEPANPSDKLQFYPSMFTSEPRSSSVRRRADASPIRSLLRRNIAYVENPERYQQTGREDYFRTGIQQMAGNAVMNHLYDIPEMQPLSIWWVILLLAALALLLGPIDYQILKRLDRLPLTWLTCTAWIVLFTAGAYYGVEHLRGGKMQLRAVSVLDAIQNTDCIWSTTYLGLFAPRSDDFIVEGPTQDQWWSGIAPSQEQIWAGQGTLGTREIYCSQQDGCNSLWSLPINIWTIQSLINEAPQQKLPIQVRLIRKGDKAVLHITNDSNSLVKTGYVRFGDKKLLPFDVVPPRTTKTFTGTLTMGQSWGKAPTLDMSYSDIQNYLQSGFQPDVAFFARGSLQRTSGIAEYLTHGAACVVAEYDNAPTPFTVKNYSCQYSHIKIVRLVVFPSADDENSNIKNPQQSEVNAK